jgi:DNA repair exonuclease SbcCD nuclease subunit
MGKKLKFIAFSDFHLGDYKEFNKDSSRINDHLEVLNYLDNKAFENGVPLLFGGDFFHNPNRVSNELLNVAFPVLLNKIRSTIIGIDGNHDQDSTSSIDRQPSSYFKTLSNIKPEIYKCVNLSNYKVKDTIIHGVPYIHYNIGFMDYVNNIKLDKNYKNILLIHTDLPDAVDTNNSSFGQVQGIKKDFYNSFSRFDLVLSGHIHKHQKLSSNTYMIGAPQEQRRTDMGCPMGYLEIYDDLSVQFKEIKFSPKFVNITDEDEKKDYKPNDYFTFVKKDKPKNKSEKVNDKKPISVKNMILTYCQDKKISKVRKLKLMKILK